MNRNKPFLLLTLANDGNKVIIAPDNIAFALRVKDGKIVFTRIILKAVLIDDDSKWVDVKETPEEISRM